MYLNKNNTLRWKWILVSAVIVTALCILGAVWFDVPMYVFFHRFNGGWAKVVDVLFSFEAWALVFVGICITLFGMDWRGEKNYDLKHYLTKKPQCLVLYSVLLASAVGQILKIVIGRMRPVFLEALGQTGFYPFTNEWAFNSMPSGHATASFAALVMIGLIYPKYKWFTWTLAILIGIARVAFGAHFPTDVLLGAFLGMVAADVVKAKI